MVKVFNIPVFFITFRETLETAIIVSVLLAFIKQTIGHDQDPWTYKKLVRQVWFGVAGGLFVCLCIGGGFIGAFYGAGRNSWSGAETVWEGSFALIATIIITIVGAGLLRVSKLKAKWQVKLAKAIESKYNTTQGSVGSHFKRWCVKYAMFNLTLITVLREGIEAVVFIAGIGLSEPASSFPLAVICALAAGCLIGGLIYKGGDMASIQIFLIASTCFLYLVAAGLLSRAVWLFEMNEWNKAIGGDAAETGAGAGSYDIRQSVWHVNCCSPNLNGGGGWGIFNALFGWQNSATFGSVISYNLYWVAVIFAFLLMRYREKNMRWPFMKSESVTEERKTSLGSSGDEGGIAYPEKAVGSNGLLSNVRSVEV